MPPRFYVPEAHSELSAIELPHDEAAHLTRVLRLGTGARIRVFDGRGAEWEAAVDSASRGRVSVRLLERVASAPEARVRINLVMAVLKADKMDGIVRDAVMLGVTRIQPLVTARTEVSRAVVERSRRIDRWQRVAVASAKQCGRAVVPQVSSPLTVDEALSEPASAIMLVEPSLESPAIALRDVAAGPAFTLLVGPEGGWTRDEVDSARERGAMLMRLGALTLRADAVPLIAIAALRVRLEDF